MSLRKQAKIIGTSHANLSRMINGKRRWNFELKARYEALVGTTFGTNTDIRDSYEDNRNTSIFTNTGTRTWDGGRYKGRTCDLCDVNAAL